MISLSSDSGGRPVLLDENVKVTEAELGQRIKALRGDRKVEALVAGSGIGAETWSRYENGRGGSPTFRRLVLIARLLGVELHELTTPDGVFPSRIAPDARLPKLRALLSDAMTLLDEPADASPEAPPMPMPMPSPGTVPAPRRGLTIVPYEVEESADAAREIHDTEVAVVQPVAASTGEVELIDTGETALVNNTIAREVLAGKGFVSKVVGRSMEDRLRDGDLVYFTHITAETIPRNAIGYVIYEGKPIVKIVRFTVGRNGVRTAFRFVSHNKDRRRFPTMIGDKDFRIVGLAKERVDKSLGSERFPEDDVEE